MLELVLLPLVCLLGGGVLGYWLCAHIHSVANAASRATTVPQGTVDSLNAKIDGLGNAVQSIAAAVQKPVVSAIESAPKA